MGEQNDLVPEANIRAALSYLLRQVMNGVNGIRAAAYPHTPEQYGGQLYMDMEAALDVTDMILEYGADGAFEKIKEQPHE